MALVMDGNDIKPYAILSRLWLRLHCDSWQLKPEAGMTRFPRDSGMIICVFTDSESGI